MSPVQNPDRAEGYRGIWFRLEQFDGDYGDKYSGGLGTYTSKHVPMAIYAPAAGKTFFTYGGTPAGDRDLQIMVSEYDHSAHKVPRPAIVDHKPEPNPSYDADTVIDPHDNATISLDPLGHLWVFVSGRSRNRPGRIYRSQDPHSVDGFDLVHEWEFFAYPQPTWFDNQALLCYTIYNSDGHRELYWRTATDGYEWTEPSKLVGIGGHYQVSDVRDETFVTACNWHPDGIPDRRTNLYVFCSRTRGETWETIEGREIEPPLEEPNNPALVIDYAAQNRLVYLNDISIDTDGNPVVLYVTSEGHEPGPKNDPRRWQLTRWTGGEWQTNTITTSDHNYDSGSLYLDDDKWFAIGPTEQGPQPYHTGGQLAIWRSTDDGESWEQIRKLPTFDGFNATYVRRPRDAAAPFEYFWADADASVESESRLYFGSLDGDVWRLPDQMDESWAEPQLMNRCGVE